MDSAVISQKLKQLVIDGQEKAAEETARALVSSGANPLEVIEEYLSPAMRTIGEKFEKGEYFLTDLMLSAEAMKAATRVLTAGMKKEDKEKFQAKVAGRVVIGTVSGDIHDIGKNIVALLLETNGFDIHDLGKDVESMKFIERATEVQADMIALSSLMTTTRPAQKEVMDFLNQLNVRQKYLVMVGGAPTTKEWAEEIGADGWAETAEEGVRLARGLVETKV